MSYLEIRVNSGGPYDDPVYPGQQQPARFVYSYTSGFSHASPLEIADALQTFLKAQGFDVG